MKKFFIIILGVVACCNTSLAQSTFKYKSERNPWDTYIGAKGGAMYCKLTNIKNNPKNPKSLLLFLEFFGLFFEMAYCVWTLFQGKVVGIASFGCFSFI